MTPHTMAAKAALMLALATHDVSTTQQMHPEPKATAEDCGCVLTGKCECAPCACQALAKLKAQAKRQKRTLVIFVGGHRAKRLPGSLSYFAHEFRGVKKGAVVFHRQGRNWYWSKLPGRPSLSTIRGAVRARPRIASLPARGACGPGG